TKWTLGELEGAFVLGAFVEARLASDEHAHEASETRALGDVELLKGHVTNLLQLTGAELGLRMTPDEWANRELQLREGCHFRWIRPGMPQGSLLLAARPRRHRAAGENGVTGRSITKIRKKTAERTAPQKLSKLVRGRPPPSSTPENKRDDDDDDDGDLLAALRSGRARGGQSAESGDSMSEDSGSDADSGATDDSDDDGSSASDGFVVSDSDDGYRRRAKRRKSVQMSDSSKRSGNHALSSHNRPKNARQRIADRLKIKL
ncbi:hypothetical protein IWW50_005823, partial [Coemansia erecta]